MTLHKITILLLTTFFACSLMGQTIPPSTSNACIGPQGELTWYYWQNVERSTLPYLYANNNYPQGPSGTLTLPTPDTPRRFDEYMGSVLKGYMTVPVAGKYAFNVLGDDRVDFYLSPDDVVENKILEVSLTSATGRTDFYGHPESHSDSLDLVTDTYYYFELHHKEQTGDDYARLYWNTPTMADSAWQIVPVNMVYNKLCETTCPPVNTACDDGDANTTNDRQDGACNCIGDQPAVLGCAGRQGVLQALTWRGVPNSGLSNLYADPRYPLMPDTVEFVQNYNHLSLYQTTNDNEYGQVIKGYMTVPATGDYQFNITADDRGVFYFSSDEEPFNMQEWCNSVAGNSIFEHDEYTAQTSPVTPLIAGQYYYFEVHYKENTNTNRFHLFWKTPYHGDDNWRVLPMTYVYEYDCETACLPDGTPCDDKNAGTFGDVISACNCAGTACPDDDCTELETYTPYDACDYTEQHSIGAGNSWVSCTTSASPNAARGDSHWILYDFNEMYSMNTSTIYNYNEVGNTGSGVKDIVIDYSVNGTDWVELGAYQVPQAPGANTYTGVIGPDLNGVGARYVLITVLTNWDNSACAGFSEIIFEATTCPDAGTLCDDGDVATTDDRYDTYCNCAGLAAPTNDCTVDSITIVDNPAQSKTYSAIKYIESNLLVDQYANTNFIAGEEIVLNPGFETELGANFLATIITCSISSLNSPENGQDEVPTIGKHTGLTGNPNETDFFVHQDLIKRLVYVKFEKKDFHTIKFRLTDYKGQSLMSEHVPQSSGFYENKINFETLPNGVYTVSVEADGMLYSKRIVLNN